jgi:translation initiation factor 1A
MPNIKGGKNYKKSKNTPDDPIFIDAADDQMYGRIVRNLGNSNMLIYCNDNKRRICHIRGGIRKKMWLNIGDIVLVSVREFVKTEIGEFERGDIITKYDSAFFGRLKKIPGFNMRLFMDLEKLSDTSAAWDSAHVDVSFENTANEDVFDRGDASDDASASDAEEEEDAPPRFNRAKAKAAAISGTDDIDIDAI